MKMVLFRIINISYKNSIYTIGIYIWYQNVQDGIS